MNINWGIIRAYLTDYVSAIWTPVRSRALSAEERKALVSAEVVPSQYGLSIAFHLRDGKVSYIPLCHTSHLKLGDTVKAANIRIITLYRKPDYIYRAVEKENAPHCESMRKRAFKRILWYRVLRHIRNLHWRIKGRKVNMFDDLVLY